MPKDTTQLTTEITEAETDFYVKLVPNLLKELSTSRKLLQTANIEHNKTKSTLEKIYKDYQTELSKTYQLTKQVKLWKTVSISLSIVIVAFLYLGSV